ncbi:MAG TPA: mechanosensitive ion channel domain-containing protein [Acidimicrobiia bacterium]|nr:mechanosensitive ion channel domain-containing protein [Acidimicrobiia bacterium]
MDAIAEWFSNGAVTGRAVLTVVLVAILVVVRWLVLRAAHGRVDSGAVYFRTKKWIGYTVTVVGVLGLTRIWFGGTGGVGTYLGILSAGIAIALANVLENLAGWVFIMTRRPFRVGDRIEIEGRSGDVVDIRAFRFSMLEIGNWVAADQSTGRLIHVPNGKVFTQQLSNYTEGFPYIWDEVTLRVTFESDWRAAERVVRDALAAHAPDTEDEAVTDAIREAGHQYLIRYRHLTPTTYLRVMEYGVEIAGRYLVGVRTRRSVADAVWRSVVESVRAEPSVEFAYPTTRMIADGTLWTQGGGGESQV